MVGCSGFASKDSDPRQRRKIKESEREKREAKKAKKSRKSKENLFKLMEPDTPNSILHNVNSSDEDTENELTKQSTTCKESETHNVSSNNVVELDRCAEEIDACNSECSNSTENIKVAHSREEDVMCKNRENVLKKSARGSVK